MKFTLPLRLVSTLNAREHHMARARRAKAEREAAYLMTPAGITASVVRITRIGKRWMDGDNLQGACKAVRDGIAQRLGVDDGDPSVTWEYAQEIGKEYAVRVEIHDRAAEGTSGTVVISAAEAERVARGIDDG